MNRMLDAIGSVLAVALLSTPVHADAWYVLVQHDSSVGITYAPPNSTGGGEPYPSLNQALEAVGAGRRVSTINLGYVLNGDLLGMQDDIRTIMARSYPDEYAALLRTRSAPAAWRGEPLRAKLQAAILKSAIVSEMKPTLKKHCHEVADVSFEKQVVNFRSGVPHFTAFVWVEIKPCVRQVQGAA